MKKTLCRRTGLIAALSTVFLVFALLALGLQIGEIRPVSAAEALNAQIVGSSTFPSINVDEAPDGLTGQSLSPTGGNGWTVDFSSAVDLSSFDTSKLVLKIWVKRTGRQQYFAQMNLNGDAYAIPSTGTGHDSSSNPINGEIGGLTGWMQLQFPLPGSVPSSVTSFWIFIADGSGNGGSSTDMRLYEYVEFAEVETPSFARLYPSVATSISLDSETMALTAENPSGQLNATIAPEGSVGTVVYQSSAPSIAEVDQTTGAVTAKNNGTATITASLSENSSVTAVCEVTVTGFSNIASVSITNGDVSLDAENKQVQLTASVLDANGDEIEDAAVEWTVVQGKAVKVDSQGLAEAVKTGTATVRATAGALYDEITVTVTGMDLVVTPSFSAPTGWQFESEESSTVPVGMSGVSYTWNGGGFIATQFASAVDLGAFDKDKAAIEFWLYIPDLSVRFQSISIFGPSEIYIYKGSANPLNALIEDGSICLGWNKIFIPFAVLNSSVDMNSFSATSRFYIFGTAVGQLFYGLQFTENNDGGTDYKVIDTQKIYTALTLNAQTLALTESDPSAALAVTPTGDLGTIRFASSNESVARVNAETGEITALGNGSATITAYVSENPEVTAECTVTVTGFIEIDRVVIAGDEQRAVSSRGPVQLEYSVLDADGNEISPDRYTAAWTVDNGDVGSVTQQGYVKFFRNGSVTVTLTVGEKSDSVAFTVTGLSNRIDLTVTSWFWSLAESESKPNGFDGAVYTLEGLSSGQGFTPTVNEADLSGLLSGKAVAYVWIFVPSADTIESTDKGVYVISYHDGRDSQNNLSESAVNALEFVAGWNLVRVPLGDTADKSMTRFWIMMRGDLSQVKIGMPWLDEVTEGECTYAIVETQTLYKSLGAENTSLQLTKSQSTAQLAVTGREGDCGTILFASSDENVVTVDRRSGALTARGNGTATVRAYLAEDPSVEIVITVGVSGMPEVKSISVTNGTEITLQVDGDHTIEVTVLEEGAAYSLSYSTDNPEVALVNGSGKIIAVGNGSAVVTVTVSGTDISAAIRVTVSDAEEKEESGCGSRISGVWGAGALLLLSACAACIAKSKKKG